MNLLHKCSRLIIQSFIGTLMFTIVSCTHPTFQPNIKKVTQTYDFTYTGVLQTGDTISFHTNAPASATFLWAFGDGTFSADTAPKHVFSTSSNYSVTLVVNSDTSNRITHLLTIATTLDFTFTGNLWIYDTIGFHTNAPAGSTFYWSFGDGTYSTDSAPKHAYQSVPHTVFPNQQLLTDTVTLVINGNTTTPITHYLAILPGASRLAGTRTWHNGWYNWVNIMTSFPDTSYSKPDTTFTITMVDDKTIMLNGNTLGYNTLCSCFSDAYPMEIYTNIAMSKDSIYYDYHYGPGHGGYYDITYSVHQ